MPTQTGSIDFRSTKGFQSYASGQYATLAQVKGQFATCSTAAATQAKAATIVPTDSGWALYEGATITVKFTTANTHATPTLNVNGTGAKSIRDHAGAALTEDAYKWAAGDALAFTYDGTYWRLQDTLAQRVTTNKTAIEQNARDILLRATKTEASQMAQPNLTPYFSMPMTKTTDDYWANITFARFTQLEDGWAHFEYDNNAGSSTVNSYIAPKIINTLKAGGRYTLLVEFRNASISKTGGSFYTQQQANAQVWGTAAYGGMAIANADIMALEDDAGSFWKPITLLTEDSKDITGTVRGTLPKTSFMYINQQTSSGQSISYDIRISLYEGDYEGPYKPYVGSQLYASQAELKLQADRIGMVVANNDASSSLQLTPAAIDAVTDNLTIKDSSGSSTVISGGKIQANSIGADELDATDINASNSLTIGALSTDTQTSILNSEVQVGGRNLLKASDATHTPTTYNAYDLYLTEPIEDGVPYVLQLWDVDVSHTGKTAATLGVSAYYCGGSVGFGGWIGTNYFTDGHADHLELRFTAYTSGATVSSGGSVNPSPTNALAHNTVVNTTNKYIRLYNSVPQASGTRSLAVGKWKLEKGNKATDWTPAPEDVDADIADAAKTATNYITADATNGIKVHDSGDTSTYVQIVSGAIDMVRSGQSMLKAWVESSVAKLRVGVATAAHIVLDGSGTTFYGSDGSAVAAVLNASTSGLKRSASLALAGRDDTGLFATGDTAAADVSLSALDAELNLETYESYDTVGGTNIYTMATLTADALRVKGSSLSTDGTYLMSRLASILDATSVTTATIGSGASSIATNVVRRWGNVVEVSLVSIELAASVSNGSYSGTLATLPSGYRPIGANVYVAAAFDGSANKGSSFVRVTTGGVIAVKNMSGAAIASGTIVTMTATFVI